MQDSTEQRPPVLRDRHADAWLFAALLLLAVLPYLNTVTNAFVYDDGKQIVENPYIRSWKYLPEIFGSNVWSFLGAAGVTNHYRPLMTLSYLICYQLFGLVPFGYHLVNLLFHAGVALLVFRVSTQLFGHRTLAFAAAALFALHPIHTESVAWVAGVTDLQLAFFYLLTFSLFLDGGPNAPPGGWRSRMTTAGSFILALFSKEPAVTLPLLATVYEHAYRVDRTSTTFRQKLGRYGILWGLALGYLLFRIWLLGSVAPVMRRVAVSWPEAILSGLALVAEYVWKLLWPLELCAHYVFRKSDSLADPRVLAGLGVVVLLAALLAALGRRHRLATFALLWFLVTLAPVLNARWMAANVFAERYLYLPSVGFCWLLAWVWWRAWEHSPTRPALRRVLVACLVLVGALYGARTVVRNRDWRNEATLYTQTLRVSPDAYLIRTNLGTVYWNSGDREAAMREWQAALPYNPDDVILLNNMGLAYAQQGRFAEAERSFRRAIEVRPDYAEPYFQLGRMYERMDRPDDALREYEAAVRAAPLHTRARNRLGFLLLAAGQLEDAREQFQQSLATQPTAAAYVGLGKVHLSRADFPAAEAAFLKALAIDSYELAAYEGLGDAYAATGRPAEALRAYDKALELSPLDASLKTKRNALRTR